MNYLNPFDYVAQIFILLPRKLFLFIAGIVINIVGWASQLLILWTALMLFWPGVDFFEHVNWLYGMIFVDPIMWAFHFFVDLTETVKVEHLDVAVGASETFFWFVMWLGCLAMTLVVGPAWVVMWLMLGYVTFVMNSVSDAVREDLLVGHGYTSPTIQNLQHLAMGRTTIQDTYDAEVQANEIAAKLSNALGGK